MSEWLETWKFWRLKELHCSYYFHDSYITFITCLIHSLGAKRVKQMWFIIAGINPEERRLEWRKFGATEVVYIYLALYS